MTLLTSTIGFPRIGINREMKKALESYWKGTTSLDTLLATSRTVDEAAWKLQLDAGVDLVGLDGTLYDQILDWIFYLGLAPKQFKELSGYELYFAMVRGAKGLTALDMSKYFDTNYHFAVPELDSDSFPKPDFSTFIAKVARGQEVVGKKAAVPIVIGPNTLVGLAKLSGVEAGEMVQRLIPAYCSLLEELAGLGVPEVQIHEPILVKTEAADLEADFKATYEAFAKVDVRINLVTFYDDIGEAYPWVVALPVAAVSLDFCGVPGASSPNNTAALIERHGFPADKRLGVGAVDGRSVWKDGPEALGVIARLRQQGITNLSLQPSVSLQHLPYDLALETDLPVGLGGRLSFATQKLADLVALSVSDAAAPVQPKHLAPEGSEDLDPSLADRSVGFEERRAQQIKTRAYPTTSIGSFPQTTSIRKARADFNKGVLSEAEYRGAVEDYIKYAIQIQEELDIDVLVHGEPERTDMVEYFGQNLEGFAFTKSGWVQSYGSRYVRPPIIHANVARRCPMTVREFQFAAGLTPRPVKGMLTGPVTILNWSFPRKDIPRSQQAFQLALALRDEVADLEKAGCKVIQVDEPALREGLPQKKDRWAPYLDWAVKAFRICCGVAAPATQIVTHLCYSDFEDILEAIDVMDADVLTIENSRSGDEMIHQLAKFGYNRDLGAGVYDVHSPVVPSVEFLEGKVASFVATGILSGHPERIWVNPDCGLKTRNWEEVIPALRNMVAAAAAMRAKLPAKA